MKKDIKFNPKTFKPQLKKLKQILVRHGSFIAIIVVLFVYLLVVWRISVYAGAEPPASDDVTTASIPKVDKSAINQIQSLAQSNQAIQSLFDNARQNPFSE